MKENWNKIPGFFFWKSCKDKQIFLIAPLIGAIFVSWIFSVAKQFTLGKKERVKSRKSIDELFRKGRKINVPLFRVLYIQKPAEDNPALQFGAGVSSKNFKKAADRNRIKRLTREAYRLQKIALQKKVAEKTMKLDLFFIYTGKELPRYSEVYEKIGFALSKLEKLL